MYMEELRNVLWTHKYDIRFLRRDSKSDLPNAKEGVELNASFSIRWCKSSGCEVPYTELRNIERQIAVSSRDKSLVIYIIRSYLNSRNIWPAQVWNCLQFLLYIATNHTLYTSTDDCELKSCLSALNRCCTADEKHQGTWFWIYHRTRSHYNTYLTSEAFISKCRYDCRNFTHWGRTSNYAEHKVMEFKQHLRAELIKLTFLPLGNLRLVGNFDTLT
jgi:hypothetical protein